jgi:hypothetical protein
MVVIEAKTNAIQLLANAIVASFGYEKVIDFVFFKNTLHFYFILFRCSYINI